MASCSADDATARSRHRGAARAAHTGGGGGGGQEAGGHRTAAAVVGATRKHDMVPNPVGGDDPAPDAAAAVFVSHKVEYVVKDILEAYLRKVKYAPAHCSKLAQDLCGIIKDKVKDMELERYRLVTHVIIGQDSDQSVQVASRCLWNHVTDNFAAATYRNNSLYAIAIVYALYLD